MDRQENRMAMVYQAGMVYEKGTRVRKWYGQFRVYRRGQDGKEVRRNKKVVLGLKSQLRKHQAEEKLRELIRQLNGKTPGGRTILLPDDKVTFDWFVKEKYLPLRRGGWRLPTRKKTEFEINRYLVEPFKGTPLGEVGLFELQTWLNGLAETFSESIVKHAFVNARSIMRVAQKLKYLPENPADELKMPITRAIERPTMTHEVIIRILDGLKDPHDLCLMCIGLFCATRTSETFGLQWKCYEGDALRIQATAFEGKLYPEQVKTEESRNRIPVPQDIRPIIDEWKRQCPDSSPEALMFPTFGRGARTGSKVPREPRNFLKWRIYPITDKLGIPRKLVTFQVMRRTVGTDLQKHGTMKDAQAVLRHASIKTTANTYMQPIPESVRAALDSRTRAIFAKRKGVQCVPSKRKAGRCARGRKGVRPKKSGRMLPNAPQFQKEVAASA
jgi:integrase